MVVCGGAFAGEGGWHFCGVNVVVGGGVWIGDLLFSLLSFVHQNAEYISIKDEFLH